MSQGLAHFAELKPQKKKNKNLGHFAKFRDRNSDLVKENFVTFCDDYAQKAMYLSSGNDW